MLRRPSARPIEQGATGSRGWHDNDISYGEELEVDRCWGCWKVVDVRVRGGSIVEEAAWAPGGWAGAGWTRDEEDEREALDVNQTALKIDWFERKPDN